MRAMLSRLDRAFFHTARAMAVLGGLVLFALILVVTISVIGRAGLPLARWPWFVETLPGLADMMGPVTGDFELIELGTAFAVFCFLPWAQLTGGHARVELFSHMLPPRAEAALNALWEAVMAATLIVIAWRLVVGLESKMASGETTFLLQIPVWWAYGAAMVAADLAAAVAVWVALRAVVAIRRAPREWQRAGR